MKSSKKNEYRYEPLEEEISYFACRIGDRIRDIRTAKNMTQAELGAKVGLSGDRIQKYENGFRKPKLSLLIQLAEVLEVEPRAIAIPDTTSNLGIMFALFEMEDVFKVNTCQIDGKVMLSFGDGKTGTLNEFLIEWEKKQRQVEEALDVAISPVSIAKVVADYDMWKWTFPKSINNGDPKSDKKMKIIGEIRKLQMQLETLDEEVNDKNS